MPVKKNLTPLSKKSSAFIEKRLKNLQSELRRRKLDALLVSHIQNIRYLSGFTGSTAMMVVTPRSSVFFSDFRYREQAQREVVGSRFVEVGGGYYGAVADHCRKKKIKQLGIEARHLTLAERRMMAKLLRGSGTKLVEDKGSVENLRLYKDSLEIGIMKKALRIACLALDDLLPHIKPGVREWDLAIELEYGMRKHGGAGVSFDSIIASGPRSALPHGIAAERKIKKGDFVVIDFGTLYQGYCSDTTRTVHVGNPSPQHKKIYQSVLNAQLQCVENAACGMSVKDVDALTRNPIAEAGFGSYYGHGTGHGVGLDVHEAPSISPKGVGKLEEGMVFTVEPGIYLPQKAGVRIEDMLAVRPGGRVELLTDYPKEMIVL